MKHILVIGSLALNYYKNDTKYANFSRHVRDLDVIMSEEAHEMFDNYINNNKNILLLDKKVITHDVQEKDNEHHQSNNINGKYVVFKKTTYLLKHKKHSHERPIFIEIETALSEIEFSDSSMNVHYNTAYQLLSLYDNVDDLNKEFSLFKKLLKNFFKSLTAISVNQYIAEETKLEKQISQEMKSKYNYDVYFDNSLVDLGCKAFNSQYLSGYNRLPAVFVLNQNSDSYKKMMGTKFYSLYGSLHLLYLIKQSHVYNKFEWHFSSAAIKSLEDFNKTRIDLFLINLILTADSSMFLLNPFLKNKCNLNSSLLSEKTTNNIKVFERLGHDSYPLVNKTEDYFVNCFVYDIKIKNNLLSSKKIKKESLYFTLSDEQYKFYKEMLFRFFDMRQKDNYFKTSLPNLNTDKKSFFKDNFYIYDHDSIHEQIAIEDKPVYLLYMKDNEPVMTDKNKFYKLDRYHQLLGVVEEAMTLACERLLLMPDNQAQIDKQLKTDNKDIFIFSFMLCLKKVCTTITSGYFREFAHENYDDAVKLFFELNPNGNEYYLRVKNNIHKLRKFCEH
jgi:putative uncharacterized protein PHG31ORF062c